MNKVCLVLIPLVVLAARAAAAAPGPQVEVGSTWLFDDWQAPDGGHYQVGGPLTDVQLSMPWLGAWKIHASGAYAPLLRPDANAWVNQYAARLFLTDQQGDDTPAGSFKKGWIELGAGVVADVQAHRGNSPVGGSLNYPDEDQWRVGPAAALDIVWPHPGDDAWRWLLNGLFIPRALGFTSGRLLYAGAWTGVELKAGPSYRWHGAELSAGGEFKYWQGDQFAEGATGIYLNARSMF